MSKKAPSFEEALARLEALADDIEQGRVGLEDSIARYEEGMKLIQRCRAVLADAEQRIIRLQAEGAEGVLDSSDNTAESSSDVL